MRKDFDLGIIYDDILLSTGDTVKVRGVNVNDVLENKELYTLPYLLSSYISVKYENKMYGQNIEEYMHKCLMFSNIGDYEVNIEDYDRVMIAISELSIPSFKKANKDIIKTKRKNNKIEDIIKMSNNDNYLNKLNITEDMHLFIRMYYFLLSKGIDCRHSTYRVIYNLFIMFDSMDKESRVSNMQDELSVQAMFQMPKEGAKVFYDRIEELNT